MMNEKLIRFVDGLLEGKNFSDQQREQVRSAAIKKYDALIAEQAGETYAYNQAVEAAQAEIAKLKPVTPEYRYTGAQTGAKPKSSTGLTIAIIIAAVAVVLLVGTLIIGTIYNVGHGLNVWGGTSNYSYSNSSSYIAAGEFSVSAANISSVDISWIAGNVTLMPCDGNEIKVREINSSTDPESDMRYKVDGKTLVIKFRSSGRFISTNLSKDLIVEIPSDVAAAIGLDIETVSADVDINTSGEVTNMSFKHVNVNTVSGHAYVADVETQKVDVETVSGNIVVSGRISTVDIDTVSGNVSFDGYINPKELNIDTVSGRVEVELIEEPKDIDIDTVSGNIIVNDVKAKRGYETENPAGVGEVDIETVSGDITIAKKP